MPPWGILGKCRDVIKWFADCIYLFITLIWKEGLEFWKGTFTLHRGSYGTREKSFLGERVHAKPLSEVTASCPSDAVMAICRGNENSNSFWLLLKTAPFVYLCCGGRSATLILVIFMAKNNPTQVFGVPKWWGRGGEGWEACGRSIPLNDFTELAISEAANRLSDQPHYGCCGFQALLSLWLSLPLRI